MASSVPATTSPATPMAGSPSRRHQQSGAPPLDAVVVLRRGDLTIDGALGTENDVLLAAHLAAVGCSPGADERAELRRAIEGALVGPKGTLMDGQMKTLRVLSVRFDR